MNKIYLAKELLRYKDKFGKTPTFREFAKASGFPAPITVVKYYGTWNKALEECGLTVRQNRYDPNEILSWINDYYNKFKKLPAHRDIPGGLRQGAITAFGSIKNCFKLALIATNLPNKVSILPTKKLLQKSIDQFILNKKRNPSLKDIGSKYIPYKRFHFKMHGGISQFWSKSYPSTNIFTTYCNYIANDGHKCFSRSEIILDDWLSKNKITHEKEIHYPKNKKLNPKNNLRCDFYIPLQNLYVEFSGMYGIPSYHKRMRRKKKLAKLNNLDLIIIGINDVLTNGHLNEKRLRSLFIPK